ncbi:MAG: hypothetical protein WAT74_15185 [Flavobacteriales bacterium]
MSNHRFVRLKALIAASLAPVLASAQGNPNWLVDTLYGSGKINTVIAVVSVILLGLAGWLFQQDRRIARMEKRIKP